MAYTLATCGRDSRYILRHKRLNKKCILSFFVVIRHHLLPLMNYLVNGQYHKVQPIVKKFTERCI